MYPPMLSWMTWMFVLIIWIIPVSKLSSEKYYIINESVIGRKVSQETKNPKIKESENNCSRQKLVRYMKKSIDSLRHFLYILNNNNRNFKVEIVNLFLEEGIMPSLCSNWNNLWVFLKERSFDFRIQEHPIAVCDMLNITSIS